MSGEGGRGRRGDRGRVWVTGFFVVCALMIEGCPQRYWYSVYGDACQFDPERSRICQQVTGDYSVLFSSGSQGGQLDVVLEIDNRGADTVYFHPEQMAVVSESGGRLGLEEVMVRGNARRIKEAVAVAPGKGVVVMFYGKSGIAKNETLRVVPGPLRNARGDVQVPLVPMKVDLARYDVLRAA